MVSVSGGALSTKWSCKLEVLWSVPTGQCVDASPLVVQKEGEERYTVYIGSHSGLFLAIEVAGGSVLWQTELGGRVESSACASQSGRYISVGGYEPPHSSLALHCFLSHFLHLSGSPVVLLHLSSSPQLSRLLQWMFVYLTGRHG